jgi:hypothetical protein
MIPTSRSTPRMISNQIHQSMGTTFPPQPLGNHPGGPQD